MASARRNLCDDILRLIDEVLGDAEHAATAMVTARLPSRWVPV